MAEACLRVDGDFEGVWPNSGCTAAIAGDGQPAGGQRGYSNARGRAPCIEPGRCAADGAGVPLLRLLVFGGLRVVRRFV